MVSWLITYRNLVITCVPQMLMVAQRTTKGKQSMNELRQRANKSHQEVGHSVVGDTRAIWEKSQFKTTEKSLFS